MSTHNICFNREIRKHILLILPLIWGYGYCSIYWRRRPWSGPTMGGRKISGLFALSQKPLNIFQTFFFLLFKVFLTCVYIFLSSSLELLYSLCKPWSRLAEVPITAEVKAALVSYLLRASLSSVLETNKSCIRQGLCCTRGSDNKCLEGVDKIYCGWGGVRGGIVIVSRKLCSFVFRDSFIPCCHFMPRNS